MHVLVCYANPCSSTLYVLFSNQLRILRFVLWPSCMQLIQMYVVECSNQLTPIVVSYYNATVLFRVHPLYLLCSSVLVKQLYVYVCVTLAIAIFHRFVDASSRTCTVRSSDFINLYQALLDLIYC